MLIKENILIIIIIAVSLILRLMGIFFGYPYALNFDEMQDIPNILKMLQDTHLKPPHYIHGSFYFYFYEFFTLIYFLLGKFLGAYKDAFDIYPVDLIVFSRCISAILGTITVYLTYKIGKLYHSKQVGLISAALLCTCFLHVMVSHYATQDALLTLLILLSFFWAIDAYKTDQLKSYILFSFFAGLSTATSMTGILSMGVIALVLYRHKNNLLNKVLLISFTALFTFLLFSPYFILDFSTYYSDIKFTLNFHETGKGAEFASDLNGEPTWLWWIKYFTSTGILWPFSIATLIGFVFLTNKRTINCLLVTIYPILWAMVLLGHSVRYDRHGTSLLPFFALIAAIGIIELYRYFQIYFKKQLSFKFVIIFFCFTFIFYPLFISSAFGYLLTKNDTSLRTTNWIIKNIKKGSNICVMTSRGTEEFSVPFNKLKDSYNTLFTHLHFDDFVTDPNIYLSEGIQYLVIGGDYSNQSIVYKNVYGNKKYNFFRQVRNNYKLLAKIEEPLFEKGFFSPRNLERSATANFNHHRTYEIYSLIKSKNINSDRQHYQYSKRYQKLFSPGDLLKFSKASLIQDKNSRLNELLYSKSTNDKSTQIIAGPYEKIPVGNYEAIFSLNVNDCDSGLPVAEIAVKTGGAKDTLSKQILYCEDFNSQKKFQKFKLSFHNPVVNSWKPQIETPIFLTGNGSLFLEFIEIKGHGLDFG